MIRNYIHVCAVFSTRMVLLYLITIIHIFIPRWYKDTVAFGIKAQGRSNGMFNQLYRFNIALLQFTV